MKEIWSESRYLRIFVYCFLLVFIPGLIHLIFVLSHFAYKETYPYARGELRNPFFVDLFDPAPEVNVPWPPIEIPSGPLPRLTQDDIGLYFFPEEAQFDENGLSIRKVLDGPVLIRVSEPGEVELDDTVLDAYRRIGKSVPRLPEAVIPSEAGGTDLPVEISAYVNRKELKAEHRDFVWEGKGPIGDRMEEAGCYAHPSFWYSGGNERDSLPSEQAFTVHQAFIATWHNIGEPTVDHCLFKALLVALGLHPTEGFFFKEGPVTPEEQARALAALALLYHPAVKPGMTEDEFVAVLLENDLIDP